MSVFYDEGVVADHDLDRLYGGFDGIFGVVETDDAVYVGTIRNHPDTLSLTVETGKRGRPNVAEYADVQNLFGV